MAKAAEQMEKALQEANKLSDMSGNDLYDNTDNFNYEIGQVDTILAEATVGSLLSLGSLLTIQANGMLAVDSLQSMPPGGTSMQG